MTDLLSMENVWAGYGETVVLRDVDITVPSSGVLAILGPNGAGKSTLLRVASGLLTPWRGDVWFAGDEVTAAPPHERVERGLCHIPDPRGIFPSLSVRDNLLLQAPRGTAAASIERAAEAFPKLGQRISQVAGTLSGGEQQMLAVARAYVQQPRLVLLDEVSMGLAPNIVDEIFAFLDQIRGDGTSLVVVEQFVHRALAMADDVAVVSKGRIVASGAAHEFDEERIFHAYSGVETAEEVQRS